MRIIILGILFFLTTFAIVYFKHENRQLFITLHDLRSERDALNSEWSQLLLEESTLISHSRVERIATEELHMFVPKDKDIVWLPMDNIE